MYQVIHAQEADSPNYVRLLMGKPIGRPQASALVVSKTTDGVEAEIFLHGQREFDVPGPVESVQFPDGSTWSPSTT